MQIDINNTQNIGETGKPDLISLTFWGTNYFKNMDGDEVLYGTELRTDVFRVISPSEAENLEIFIDISKPVILIILILCIVWAQLPTWMFLNSLSLIVHTTLLNSLMPPSVFYVFKKYLDMIRLNSADFNEYIEDK